MITTTKRSPVLFLGLIIAAMATGCNKAEIATNQSGNSSISNTAPIANSIANTAPTANAAVEPAGYSLASPSDTYHAAFEARRNCDIPMLKRVMSEAMTEAMTQRGENDPKGKKTLDETLKDLCEMPQAPNGDIKDEKIVEDEGTIKYQDERGVWRLMDFVREKGEWKLTLPRGKGELPALK